jgi:hypothetical protein
LNYGIATFTKVRSLIVLISIEPELPSACPTFLAGFSGIRRKWDFRMMTEADTAQRICFPHNSSYWTDISNQCGIVKLKINYFIDSELGLLGELVRKS